MICLSRRLLKEFGIDIVGEDNKTIVHHKVVARVVCVFTEQDIQAVAHVEQQQQPQNPQGYTLTSHHQAVNSGPGPSNAFNFNGSRGAPRPPRWPAMQPQGLNGMGGKMRAPGKSPSRLTFEHILTRLQSELQKSRETGTELHSLTGAMSDIHDTLGGLMVSRHSCSSIASILTWSGSFSPQISLTYRIYLQSCIFSNTLRKLLLHHLLH